MAYRVKISTRARRNLRKIYGDIEANHSAQAKDWFNGLESLILSLDENPLRGSITPELSDLRQLLYGKSPNTYRIIYAVDKRNEVVNVLYVRHGARQALS